MDLANGPVADPAAPALRVGLAEQTHAAPEFRGGTIAIGSAADNDVVLAGAGVAAHHVSLTFAWGVWVLRVLPGGERIHVNSRPVRELALVRVGDGISIGEARLVLLPPAAGASAPPRPGQGELPAMRACPGLRVVAGPLSGRFLAISPELQLDDFLLPGMAGALQLRRVPEGVHFERVGAAEPAPVRNGERVSRGVLQPEDQLGLGRHRFVLEGSVCTMPEEVPAGSVVVPAAVPAPAAAGNDLAWLVGVAAALAVLLTLLLVGG